MTELNISYVHLQKCGLIDHSNSNVFLLNYFIMSPDSICIYFFVLASSTDMA
jgi:hypothetical protein